MLYMCPPTAIYVSSYCYVCVLLPLYMCPHTAISLPSYRIHVFSYCYICVLILLYMFPHTAIYVSSYCYIFVLILLYMCPRVLVFSYCYICRSARVGDAARFNPAASTRQHAACGSSSRLRRMTELKHFTSLAKPPPTSSRLRSGPLVASNHKRRPQFHLDLALTPTFFSHLCSCLLNLCQDVSQKIPLRISL